jgi:ABC-type glycerol-3-phosphate transport system substrate-binding protein
MRSRVTRRDALKTAALATTALIAAPYVRGAHAAGSLSIGFWDHWVPGANKATETIVNAWAEKNKVQVSMDFIPSQGNKNLITIAAESQAKSGHDIFAFPAWYIQAYQQQLVDVTDVMDPLIKQNGAVNDTVTYLSKINNKWYSVPATVGSQIKGPCSRIDLMKQHAGIDVQALYPAGQAPKADSWNYDTYLKAAEACQKAGFAFGVGLGQTTDSVDTAGAFFHGFGADLVNAKGDITVKSDAVRQALEYCVKVAKFYPPDAPAWDDASNNKWLVSGRGAMLRKLPSSAGRMASRSARRAASRRSSRTSGASGTSRRMYPRRRACSPSSRSRRQPRRWWRPRAATICPRSPI